MRFLVAYLAGSNGGGPYTFLGMLTTLTELFCADDFDISNINVINFLVLNHILCYFMYQTFDSIYYLSNDCLI